MKILGIKSTHDGALALLDDGRLDFSIEQEKDSHPRNSRLGYPAMLRVLERLQEMPDVIALGGWRNFGAGYCGVDRFHRSKRKFLGKEVEIFASSHERAHIFGTYAMSPFEAGRACYVLTWEGEIGTFYKIGENMEITTYPTVLYSPGPRYTYLYYLAKKNQVPTGNWFEEQNMAGKVMALAAYGQPSPCSRDEKRIMDYLLSTRAKTGPDMVKFLPLKKGELAEGRPFVDIGEESEVFKSVAYKMSEALFDVFYKYAAKHLREKLPLLVNGGCGLNCDWNSKWKDCGLFPEVFVPPCPNDAGSAIGTAADAQYSYTGNPKIKWSVYAGEEFVDDCPEPDGWDRSPLDLEKVAAFLKSGGVVAWVQGKYEIGPRALGNRSLLAAPFERATTTELNRIKEREGFRPIAPVCLVEDVSEHFEWTGPSPHMLYFQKVKDSRLRAVTHVDGSARAQTVSREDNPILHDLLSTFKRRAGVGVLCNTSLNFKGKGFINNTTDLIKYVADRKINMIVINGMMLERRAWYRAILG